MDFFILHSIKSVKSADKSGDFYIIFPVKQYFFIIYVAISKKQTIFAPVIRTMNNECGTGRLNNKFIIVCSWLII
jgi:hypothetical protein